MRRLLISLAALLPLVGAAAVQADGFGGSSGGGASSNQAAVVGTIVSVDAANGTFVANAFVVPPYDGGRGFGDGGYGSGGYGPGGSGTTGATGATGFGGGFSADRQALSASTTTAGQTGPTMPAPTQVTITVGTSTVVSVRGSSSTTISALVPGDRFRATFTGSPSDSISTLLANPALSVMAAPAPKQHQLYAFVGSVTGKTSSTVTVTVSASYPSGLIASGTSATFTVGTSTMVLGGSSSFGFTMGGLTNVAVGDIVAGGLIGAASQTAAQVEGQPLMLLLDLPTSLTSGTTGTTGATGVSGVSGVSSLKATKASGLRRAESLLRTLTSKTTHKKAHKTRKTRKTHKTHKAHKAHKKS